MVLIKVVRIGIVYIVEARVGLEEEKEMLEEKEEQLVVEEIFIMRQDS